MVPQKGTRCHECHHPIEDTTDVVEITKEIEGCQVFIHSHPPGKCPIVSPSSSSKLNTSEEQNKQFCGDWSLITQSAV